MSMKIRLSSRQDTIVILDALQITVDDTNGLAPDRRRALQSQLQRVAACVTQNTKNERQPEVENLVSTSIKCLSGQIRELKSVIQSQQLRVPELVLKQTGSQLNIMQRLATSRYDLQKSVLDKVVKKTKRLTTCRAFHDELSSQFSSLHLRLKVAMEKLGKTISQIGSVEWPPVE